MSDETEKKIDTSNKFLVGRNGAKTVILIQPFPLTSDDALSLAAWIVAVNYNRIEEFQDLLARVLET